MLDNDEHPKVFISYSWDSEEHKKWVLNLANDLRDQGIDAIVDEFITQISTQDLNRLMIENINNNDFVIIILTEKYAKKANEYKGGVGFETNFLINLREKNIEKLILIAKPEKSFEECFPLYLEKVYCLDFSKDYDIDELARRIYKEPKYIKNDLGKRKEYKPIVLSSNLEYMSDEEKFKYFLIEAEKNNTKAQFIVGVMYHKGEGVEQNYRKVVEWFTKAARQGDFKAQFYLSSMYHEGKDIEQNHEKAAYWSKKWAKQIRGSIYFDLGLLDYGKQNYEKAIYWYTVAAKQGHNSAQFSLGAMYECGEGIEQNYEKAIYWYTKAAKQRNEDAKKALEKLKEK